MTIIDGRGKRISRDVILKAMTVVQVRDAGWVEVIPVEMEKESGQIWDKSWWSDLLDLVIE